MLFSSYVCYKITYLGYNLVFLWFPYIFTVSTIPGGKDTGCLLLYTLEIFGHEGKQEKYLLSLLTALC